MWRKGPGSQSLGGFLIFKSIGNPQYLYLWLVITRRDSSGQSQPLNMKEHGGSKPRLKLEIGVAIQETEVCCLSSINCLLKQTNNKNRDYLEE